MAVGDSMRAASSRPMTPPVRSQARPGRPGQNHHVSGETTDGGASIVIARVEIVAPAGLRLSTVMCIEISVSLEPHCIYHGLTIITCESASTAIAPNAGRADPHRIDIFIGRV